MYVCVCVCVCVSTLKLDPLSPWPKATHPQPHSMPPSLHRFKDFVLDTSSMKSAKMLASFTAVFRKYSKNSSRINCAEWMNYSTPGGFKDTSSPHSCGCPKKFMKMLFSNEDHRLSTRLVHCRIYTHIYKYIQSYICIFMYIEYI